MVLLGLATTLTDFFASTLSRDRAGFTRVKTDDVSAADVRRIANDARHAASAHVSARRGGGQHAPLSGGDDYDGDGPCFVGQIGGTADSTAGAYCE